MSQGFLDNPSDDGCDRPYQQGDRKVSARDLNQAMRRGRKEGSVGGGLSSFEDDTSFSVSSTPVTKAPIFGINCTGEDAKRYSIFAIGELPDVEGEDKPTCKGYCVGALVCAGDGCLQTIVTNGNATVESDGMLSVCSIADDPMMINVGENEDKYPLPCQCFGPVKGTCFANTDGSGLISLCEPFEIADGLGGMMNVVWAIPQASEHVLAVAISAVSQQNIDEAGGIFGPVAFRYLCIGENGLEELANEKGSAIFAAHVLCPIAADQVVIVESHPLIGKIASPACPGDLCDQLHQLPIKGKSDISQGFDANSIYVAITSSGLGTDLGDSTSSCARLSFCDVISCIPNFGGDDGGYPSSYQRFITPECETILFCDQLRRDATQGPIDSGGELGEGDYVFSWGANGKPEARRFVPGEVGCVHEPCTFWSTDSIPVRTEIPMWPLPDPSKRIDYLEPAEDPIDVITTTGEECEVLEDYDVAVVCLDDGNIMVTQTKTTKTIKEPGETAQVYSGSPNTAYGFDGPTPTRIMTPKDTIYAWPSYPQLISKLVCADPDFDPLVQEITPLKDASNNNHNDDESNSPDV